MAHLTAGQITFGKTASFLGIIQGLVWFVMSLLCIIEFSINEPPGNNSTAGTYMDSFNDRVYRMYLYQDAVLPAGTALTPVAFAVFVCIYIVLDTIWVVISLFQLNVLKKGSMNIPVLFKDWALITWLISLVDFIMVVLIGADYNQHCLPEYEDAYCINTMIPVMVIAARGFMLWFVNVFVAWNLNQNARLLRKGGSYKGTFGGIVPFYRPVGHIPRATVAPMPSLYDQQLRAVREEKNHWNVNLRTAMDNRTPPITPRTPYGQNQQQFFTRY